jgi:hypothetical protein
MKILNRNETNKWCIERNVQVDSGVPKANIFNDECIELEFPNYPSRFVYLSWVLVDMYANEESTTFSGGLVSITMYGLETFPMEDIGFRVIDRFRNEKSKSTIEEYPSHLFSKEEKIDAAISLFDTMNFGWDSIWLPISGDYFVFKSHDDIIYLLVRNSEDLKYFFTELEELKFKVKIVKTPSLLKI